MMLHRSPRTRATLLRLQQTLLSTSTTPPRTFDPVKPKSQKPLGSLVICKYKTKPLHMPNLYPLLYPLILPPDACITFIIHTPLFYDEDHNPDCETSRNVLNIINAAGYKPTIIEYLQIGWTKSQLQGLFAAADLTPRTALRTTKSPAEELGLLNPSVTDDTIMENMLLHPVLVNRPIVCR